VEDMQWKVPALRGNGSGVRELSGARVAEIGRHGKWTAAAAARAAREARIATVAHLRSAWIAHEWEASNLIRAEQIWRAHLTAQLQEGIPDLDPTSETCAHLTTGLMGPLLYGASGLRAPYPADVDEAARRMLDCRADDLDAATLYVLSPSMCDVVTAAALTLTLDDTAMLDSEDLPSPTGLIMLPHPLLVRSPAGDLCDDRAYTWHSPATLPFSDPDFLQRPAGGEGGEGDGVDEVAGVRIASYLDSYGPVRPPGFTAMAALAAADHTPLPPLTQDHTRTLPFRVAVSDDVRTTTDRFSAVSRDHGEQTRRRIAELGYDTADGLDTASEYRPGDEIDDAEGQFAARFLYAFWRLCAQQITEITDAPAGHNARLQAGRAGVSHEVRIATIRPTHTSTTRAGDHGSPDWRHRWVVRMHKVRQWYPTEQRHKILYRGPYVKGPADKPLLGGESVRNLPPRRLPH
jgi:hypothetical protein